MVKNPNWQESVNQRIAALKEKNLYRSLKVVESAPGPVICIDGRKLLNFSSNNYLGLANHPKIKQAVISAVRKWGAGSGASRLISGSLKIHLALEKKLARFKKEEAATVFSSGYLANLGAVTSLVGEKDLVLVDRLNHASLIDAARLSRAKLWVYSHHDVKALDRLLDRGKNFEKKLVLTDSYFSMDGEVAPLDKLLEICKRHDAMLMVDEAHATGIFGKNGSGLTEQFSLSGKIDVVMGTLSKALGSTGGFICGRAVLKECLINCSREFIYTTAPVPAASAAASAAIGVIENQPLLRKRYWENILYVRAKLKNLGFDLGCSEGPIIPLFIGDTKKTLSIQRFLMRQGIFAPAIRPPSVPKNTDRIRLSVTADHTQDDLNCLLSVLKKTRRNVL